MSDMFDHHPLPTPEEMETRRMRKPPRPWREVRSKIRHRWLELLEYLGTFSILIAVIVYFVEAPQRRKTKHYQAWQVINTAQGKGGSGGRIDALEQLNEDGVALEGGDVSDASLQG